MKILTGNSNKHLSQKISKFLKNRLVNSNIRKFADGEIYIEINENIRGNSIFLIQSVSSPANDNLMELLLSIDALKRSSAKNITAVIPYFGYARQDRKGFLEHLYLLNLYLILLQKQEQTESLQLIYTLDKFKDFLILQ